MPRALLLDLDMGKYIDAEKLKAKIERLNAIVSYESKDRHDEGLHDAYKAVKNVIDSLQQERTDFPITDEQIKEFLATNPKIEVPEKYKNPDWLFKKQEQPEVDLEKEYKEYVEDDPVFSILTNRNVGLTIARHFAQWGAEHIADARKTSPKDLEEAKEAYCEEHNDECFDACGSKCPHIRNAFIAGAKWQADHEPLHEDTVLFNKGVEEGKRLMMEEQADLFTIVALDAAQRAKEQMLKDGLDAVKSGQSNKIEKTIAGVFVKYGMDRQKEQMMKGAVEGEIIKDSRGNNVVRAGVFNKDFECGDKVRVIILPKED